MPGWLQTITPAAPARLHLLTAALAWTVVGTTLMLLGIEWAGDGQPNHAAPLLGLAVTAGVLKSRFMLDRVARRIVGRIRRRGDGRCIGGFLSPRSWFFLGAMVGCGRLLRASPLPHTAVGVIYVAVGTALLVSARAFWFAWQRHGETSPS